MSIDAMKQALGALEDVMYWDNGKSEWEEARAAITALRTAIAEAEKQEPLAWQHRMPICDSQGKTLGYSAWKDGKGLDWWPHRAIYTHPAPAAQRQPLTEGEIHNLDPLPHRMFDKQRIDFARAIEAAHGITGEKA